MPALAFRGAAWGGSAAVRAVWFRDDSAGSVFRSVSAAAFFRALQGCNIIREYRNNLHASFCVSH